MSNNIIFYIYIPKEKAAYLFSLSNCSDKRKNKISNILKEKFDNLFYYDELSGYKIYSSGWVVNSGILGMLKDNYYKTMEIFHYEERQDLQNYGIMAEIQATNS